MSLILDIVLIGIILVCVFLSAKQGFVRVLVETVGFVVAMMIAFSVSTPLAETTYNKFIEPKIIKSVESNEVMEAVPDFIIDNGDKFGISVDELTEKLTSGVANGTTQVLQSASDDIIKPVAVKVIGMIYSLILVTILLVVVRFLARIINKLFSFSIVGKLNRTLGGVVGLLKGIVISVVLCLLVSVIMAFAGDFLIFTSENVNNSILFKFIINNISIF